jgi:hypothetical protein
VRDLFRRVPAPEREPPPQPIRSREAMFRHISIRERERERERTPSSSPPPSRERWSPVSEEHQKTVIDERTRERDFYEYGDGYVYTRDLRGNRYS